MIQSGLKGEHLERSEKNWRKNVGTFTGLPALFLHNTLFWGGLHSDQWSIPVTLASMVACNLASYPFSTVYSRYLLDRTRDEPKYSSSIDCMRQILNNEGFMSLYSGYATYTYRYSPYYLGMAISAVLPKYLSSKN